MQIHITVIIDNNSIILIHHIVCNIATLMHLIVNTRRNQATPSPSFWWLEWALLPLDVSSSLFSYE
jgi:hypothetical protein